jgi:hypothetical protein
VCEDDGVARRRGALAMSLPDEDVGELVGELVGAVSSAPPNN